MKLFNADDEFEPILADIESGGIKTAHKLRLALENLSEQSDIKTLRILEMFRQWLANKNIDLSTENGMVMISKMVDKK